MWHLQNSLPRWFGFIYVNVHLLDLLRCLTPTACEVRKEPLIAAFGLLDYGCTCYTQLNPKHFETLQTLSYMERVAKVSNILPSGF